MKRRLRETAASSTLDMIFLLSVLLRFDDAVIMFFMSWRIGGWVYLANIYIPCQTLSQVCRPGQTTNKVALRLDRL